MHALLIGICRTCSHKQLICKHIKHVRVICGRLWKYSRGHPKHTFKDFWDYRPSTSRKSISVVVWNSNFTRLCSSTLTSLGTCFVCWQWKSQPSGILQQRQQVKHWWLGSIGYWSSLWGVLQVNNPVNLFASHSLPSEKHTKYGWVIYYSYLGAISRCLLDGVGMQMNYCRRVYTTTWLIPPHYSLL